MAAGARDGPKDHRVALVLRLSVPAFNICKGAKVEVSAKGEQILVKKLATFCQDVKRWDSRAVTVYDHLEENDFDELMKQIRQEFQHTLKAAQKQLVEAEKIREAVTHIEDIHDIEQQFGKAITMPDPIENVSRRPSVSGLVVPGGANGRRRRGSLSQSGDLPLAGISEAPKGSEAKDRDRFASNCSVSGRPPLKDIREEERKRPGQLAPLARSGSGDAVKSPGRQEGGKEKKGNGVRGKMASVRRIFQKGNKDEMSRGPSAPVALPKLQEATADARHDEPPLAPGPVHLSPLACSQAAVSSTNNASHGTAPEKPVLAFQVTDLDGEGKDAATPLPSGSVRPPSSANSVLPSNSLLPSPSWRSQGVLPSPSWMSKGGSSVVGSRRTSNASSSGLSAQLSSITAKLNAMFTRERRDGETSVVHMARAPSDPEDLET